MVTKIVVLCALLALSSACKPVGKGAVSPAFAKDGVLSDLKNQCAGDLPDGATPVGVWSLKESQSGIIIDTQITISTASMTMNVACSANGKTTTVSTTVATTLTGYSIAVYKGGKKEELNSTPKCSAVIPQGGVPFSLQGNCMTLNFGGKIVQMIKGPVPASDAGPTS